MSESRSGLRAAIDHVDEELARARSLDEDTRERVRQALEALHAAVEEAEPEAHVRDNLFELVEHFAEEHPTLSAALGRVIDTLAKMGI